MTAETALAGAAPGFASPAIREREPPDWLRAQKLTPARARELLADLESPCPGEDADAQRRHSDAHAKKFALLVFSMGAANALLAAFRVLHRHTCCECWGAVHKRFSSTLAQRTLTR